MGIFLFKMERTDIRLPEYLSFIVCEKWGNFGVSAASYWQHLL